MVLGYKLHILCEARRPILGNLTLNAAKKWCSSFPRGDFATTELLLDL